MSTDDAGETIFLVDDAAPMQEQDGREVMDVMSVL
jgi:hypothetical protein